jgi:hypothetical protein
MQPSNPHPWTLTTGKHGIISVRSVRVRFVCAFFSPDTRNGSYHLACMAMVLVPGTFFG